MLTDQQLLRRLAKLCRLGRRIDVSVICLLIDVEDRRLHLEAACSSLHDFCRRKLRWSEGTTHRRIEAARIARRCPAILDHLRRGTITMSALAQLRDHVDASNVDEWVERVAGKSRTQIDTLLADLAPRPDVPSLIRRLPEPTPPVVSASTAIETTPAAPPAASTAPPTPPGRVAPLGAQRWKVQLTANEALHDKLERARTLMAHRNPSGDLAVVLEAALDALLERLEKPRRPPAPKRVAKSSDAPPPPPASPDDDAAKPSLANGTVSRAVRGEVFARDGSQCTFVSAAGERCPATRRLEIDHIHARALGGSGELENLRLRCRAHNRLHAEQDFGRAYVEQRIKARKEARATSTVESGNR